jgi:hypothetical protein
MTNIEYIFEFANKHNFPKTDCEVIFNANDDGSGMDIYTTDDDIIAVKFDESLVNNEITIEDIRFDIDSDFPEDVFFMWQKDIPEVSFKEWISMGRYIPTIVQNVEFFDELDRLTKEIEIKMKTMFTILEDDGDSDFDDDEFDDDEFDDEFDDDSDYYEDGED